MMMAVLTREPGPAFILRGCEPYVSKFVKGTWRGLAGTMPLAREYLENLQRHAQHPPPPPLPPYVMYDWMATDLVHGGMILGAQEMRFRCRVGGCLGCVDVDLGYLQWYHGTMPSYVRVCQNEFCIGHVAGELLIDGVWQSRVLCK